MFLSELESLNESEGFVDRSSNWEIVQGGLSQDSFLVDDEQSSEFVRNIRGEKHGKRNQVAGELPEGDSLFGDEHFVIGGHLLLDVSDERNVDLSKTSLLSWGVDPSQVSELGYQKHSGMIRIPWSPQTLQ